MADNGKIIGALSGSKRRTQQELQFCHDQPTTKMKRVDDEIQDYDTTEKRSKHDTENGDDHHDDWSEEQHKRFVSSIFEIGLKHASPAIILENMTQKVETITSERVKSKLQKYRNEKNKEKSKEEFMKNYCDFLERLKSIRAASQAGNGLTHHHGFDASPSHSFVSQVIEAMDASGTDSKFLLGGNVAGYLTHVVMREDKEKKNAGGQASPDGTVSSRVLSTNVLRKGAREYVNNYAGSAIKFPILTETEKKSSLGIAMTFIAGLFLTMSQHLTRERARAETIGLKLPASPTHLVEPANTSDAIVNGHDKSSQKNERYIN